jgi:hypothetical protein
MGKEQDMRSTFFIVPGLAAMAAMHAGWSVAAPLRPALPDSKPLIIQAQYDCHNRTHNHYLPEWGVSVPHHHVGPDCRPVRDENDMGDVRSEYYFGFGDGDYRRGDGEYRRDHSRRRSRDHWDNDRWDND